MADIDLPVWSVPPNWSTPVVERLEWLTDVMSSKSGAEQRRAVRLTPRRFFDYTINPVDSVRSLVDQWAHRISDERLLLPLWHDKGRLTESALEDAERIEIDTQWMEFTVGGLALLFHNPFKYEVVEISGIDDDGLDLATELAEDWMEGTSVYPLRRAWMDPEINLSAITSRVGDSSLSFMLDTDNPFATGAEPLPIYDGYPVIMLEPNRLDSLETNYGRVMDELDLRIGRIRRFDENTRSFQTQFYNWQAKGRQAHAALRQTLYRLKGRQKGIWMPSFNQDVVLTEAVSAGENFLDIHKIGYTQLGGVIDGRDRVMIRDDTGVQRIVRVNGSANQSATVERLALTANAGFAAAIGRPGSFLSLMRLDQDIVEITHHTDSEGVCEATAAFKSFSGARAAPAILVQPTPEAEMILEPCGNSPNAPCAPQYFSGWDYEISLRKVFTRWNSDVGLYIWPPPGGAGGNAFGGAIGSDFNALFGAGSPNNQGNQRWGARRVNMGDPDAPGAPTGVGNWNAFLDVGIVNYFGTPAEDWNTLDLYVYMRHWSEPFPGNLAWTVLGYGGNGDLNPVVPQDIDWKIYR